MARWVLVLATGLDSRRVTLPEFPTKPQAERYARAEYGRHFGAVVSVASEEIGRREKVGPEPDAA